VGSFSVGCSVENVAHRDRQALVAKALVDTGSEYTWLPQEVLSGIGIRREKKDVQFVMANGTTVTRGVGFAIIRIGEHFTVDEVVFAEPGDLALLGARTLEGLSLVVDPRRKKLVAAGPIPAA
jgi:predicted aspartyl protease